MRQKLKQKWTIFAALAVIIMTGCVLFYTTNPVQAAHKHSYRWVIKKNATCTSEGYKNYECSCGSCTGSQTIPKTPHNFNLNAATCTTAKKCRTCGYVAQGATGHSWNRSSATCTASKSCTKCGAVSQSALGHCYVQVTTKQPTCGTGGTFETKCTRCGIGSPTGNGTIPATGMHTWNRAEATCTAAKKCKTCGTVGQAAKGHNYYWVEVVSPTCAQVGRRDLRCATCGCVSDSQTLEKVPSHVMTVTRVEPTYTTDGYVKKHCTICSYVESNTVLPKLPSYCGVMLNPHNGDVNMTVSVIQGKPYGDVFPTVSKTGYTFSGWYTEKDGGIKITSESIVPYATVVQLHAHWQSVSCTVTLYAKGSSQENAVGEGTEFVFPSVTTVPDGEKFVGWRFLDEGFQPGLVFQPGDRVTINTTTAFSAIYLPSGYLNTVISLDEFGGEGNIVAGHLDSYVSKKLNEKPTTTTEIIKSGRDFIEAWNAMPYEQFAVVISTHGDPYNLLGVNGEYSIFGVDQVEDLYFKKVSYIILTGCNHGHYDTRTDNIARAFAEKFGAIVIAADGTVNTDKDKDTGRFLPKMNYPGWKEYNFSGRTDCYGWLVYVPKSLSDNGQEKVYSMGRWGYTVEQMLNEFSEKNYSDISQ